MLIVINNNIIFTSDTVRISRKNAYYIQLLQTFYTNNFTHNNSMDVIILFLYKETEAQRG